MRRTATAAAVGSLLLALTSCSQSTSSDACAEVRASVDQQVAAGEAKGVEASTLAGAPEGIALGSPARAKHEALVRESLVLEIPALARAVASGDCYSDEEITQASDKLNALAASFSKYAGR